MKFVHHGAAVGKSSIAKIAYWLLTAALAIAIFRIETAIIALIGGAR